MKIEIRDFNLKDENIYKSVVFGAAVWMVVTAVGNESLTSWVVDVGMAKAPMVLFSLFYYSLTFAASVILMYIILSKLTKISVESEKDVVEISIDSGLGLYIGPDEVEGYQCFNPDMDMIAYSINNSDSINLSRQDVGIYIDKEDISDDINIACRQMTNKNFFRLNSKEVVSNYRFTMSKIKEAN